MKKRVRYLAVLLIAAFGVCGCIGEDGADGEIQNHVIVGDAVPEFIVSDADGGSFSSSDFLGKRSLIVFYTVTCGDCRTALPIINEVYKAAETNPENMTVVLIARLDTPEEVSAYWSKAGYAMHTYFDPDKSVFLKFANMTVPRLYIVNESGVVEWMAIEAFSETAEDILEMLRRSL